MEGGEDHGKGKIKGAKEMEGKGGQEQEKGRSRGSRVRGPRKWKVEGAKEMEGRGGQGNGKSRGSRKMTVEGLIAN